MRVFNWLTRHYVASLVGAAVIGASITGITYYLVQPEPASFRAGPIPDIPPSPRAQLPPPPPADAPLAELAAWVRPRDEEYHWLDLPWQKSILKAQEIARKTRRLVFLWGTNAPVGRC